jgi:hypothetical protein
MPGLVYRELAWLEGDASRAAALGRHPPDRLLAFFVRIEWTKQSQMIVVECVPSGLCDPEQVDVFSGNVGGCEMLHDGVSPPARSIYFGVGLSEAAVPKAFFWNSASDSISLRA